MSEIVMRKSDLKIGMIPQKLEWLASLLNEWQTMQTLGLIRLFPYATGLQCMLSHVYSRTFRVND